MDILQLLTKCEDFKSFEVLVGNGHLSHSYLIISPDDIQNEQFCRVLAIKVLCEYKKPCFECAGCKKILKGFHPDLLIYPKDATKKFVVADSANIIENANIKPMEAEYKVFIINGIDRSTPQAQNKLLKTIEEAPKNVLFFFNATNKNKILQTIISRTQSIELRPLATKLLDEYLTAYRLESKEKANDVTNEMAISLGGGYLGKTVGFVFSKQTEEYDFVLGLISNMKSSKDVVRYVSKFAEKSGFITRLAILQNLFEELMFYRLLPEYKGRLLSEFKGWENAKNEYTAEAISEIMDYITLARKQFESNVNPTIITDYLLLKILEVKYKWNTKK